MVTRTDKKFGGDRNQCPSCGELFNSTGAFDKHRTGRFGIEDPKREGYFLPANRRCMTPDEMLKKGMVKRNSGFWVRKPMQIGRQGYTAPLGSTNAVELIPTHG